MEEGQCDLKLEDPERIPLVDAAMCGHTETVRYLLQLGCDIECRDEDDLTAICYAAQGDHVDTAHCLIEYGADTSHEFDDGIGMYPVSEALEGHHTETVRLLLKYMDLTTLPRYDNKKSVLLCAAAACSSGTL